MRVIFLCGSLEQGRDGVGDYVRQLSFTLSAAGHQVAIVAINDRYITEIQESNIDAKDHTIDMLRLPENLAAPEKQARLKNRINEFNPDWLSLQYVPFSFQRKGLCFGLAKMLRLAGGKRNWHLMVHEFSVGLDVESNTKLRVWGWAQQYLMRELIRVLNPAVIHTHTLVYKILLEKYGAKVSILPLFSNIPMLYAENVARKAAFKADQEESIDIVVFASIQERAPIRQLAAEAAAYGKAQHKKMNLIFLGRSGKEQQNWIDEWETAGLTTELMGEQSEEVVSEILSKVRFGIFTTPVLTAGKSGAVAAMREHGIELICVSRSWQPRGLSDRKIENAFDIFEYKEGNLAEFFERQPKLPFVPALPQVGEQFITNLLNINQSTKPGAMKVIISHPTGNSVSRSAAKGLLDDNLLKAFYTTVATFPGDMLDRLSKINSFAELKRRSYDPSLRAVTRSWPWIELGRMAAGKAGLKKLTAHEYGRFSVDSVYKSIDKRVAGDLKKSIAKCQLAVYAYEDGALHSFTEAKRLGVACFYDLPIGYWRSARHLMKTEIERWPEWASTLTGFRDSDEKLARKDEELRLADRIYVASSFTARTLNDYPGKLAPVEVIPYGFPPVAERRIYSNPTNRPVKLLFVGGLSQRKGIADLFAAVKNIGNKVELTVVGRKTSAECPALDAALLEHKWIPSLPHDQVLKLMQEHDILVFPSLFEGFGMVITEAMSQGTPVITTDRTAGPDLIVHDQNGWIVAAGSTIALQEQIEKLIENPERIAIAGLAAMETARLRPQLKYGEELSKALIKNFK